MAKIVTTNVIASQSSDGLNKQINEAVESIQTRGNDAEIQFVPPVKEPGFSTIWSSLVIEREGHPF
jgi:hypothetical protein